MFKNLPDKPTINSIEQEFNELVHKYKDTKSILITIQHEKTKVNNLHALTFTADSYDYKILRSVLQQADNIAKSYNAPFTTEIGTGTKSIDRPLRILYKI